MIALNRTILIVFTALCAGMVGELLAQNVTNLQPYLVSLEDKQQSHVCSGTILKRRWILTAAQCVYGAAPGNFTVRVGFGVSTNGSHFSRVAVRRMFIHPNYTNSSSNDLALLKLETPLPLSGAIKTIKIRENRVPVNASVNVFVWDRTASNNNNNGNGTQLQNFKAIPSKVLSSEICGTRVLLDFKEVICLEHKKDEGVCHGDSGGPAVLDGKLVGVASFIMGQCGGRRPDVYARVSSFVDWIDGIIE